MLVVQRIVLLVVTICKLNRCLVNKRDQLATRRALKGSRGRRIGHRGKLRRRHQRRGEGERGEGEELVLKHVEDEQQRNPDLDEDASSSGVNVNAQRLRGGRLEWDPQLIDFWRARKKRH